MSETYQREWVQKAEEDYQAALALSRLRKRPTPNAVSFHCQQCAEKYLKAFLVSKDIKFPKTHDLLELHRLCLTIDPSFEIIGDLLDRLNPYSIGYRYPGEEVTIEESKSTLKAAKDVRKFIRTLLVERFK